MNSGRCSRDGTRQLVSCLRRRPVYSLRVSACFLCVRQKRGLIGRHHALRPVGGQTPARSGNRHEGDGMNDNLAGVRRRCTTHVLVRYGAVCPLKRSRRPAMVDLAINHDDTDMRRLDDLHPLPELIEIGTRNCTPKWIMRGSAIGAAQHDPQPRRVDIAKRGAPTPSSASQSTARGAYCNDDDGEGLCALARSIRGSSAVAAKGARARERMPGMGSIQQRCCCLSCSNPKPARSGRCHRPAPASQRPCRVAYRCTVIDLRP